MKENYNGLTEKLEIKPEKEKTKESGEGEDLTNVRGKDYHGIFCYRQDSRHYVQQMAISCEDNIFSFTHKCLISILFVQGIFKG